MGDGLNVNTERGRFQRLLHLNDRRYNYLIIALRNFFSELFGTGVLVFLGCLSTNRFGQENDHAGTALSFAMAVFVAVQICCHNSGGHVNPSVTIVSLFFRRLTVDMAIIYIIAQLLGGILGFGLLKFITPFHLHYERYGICTTVPNPDLTLVQALAAEFALTTLLMLIVCSAWDPRNNQHDSMTLKFGFAIYSLAYGGTAYSGCSMNTARSLGPALWNWSWHNHWIYWVSPISAAFFSGFVYTQFFCGPIQRPLPPERFKSLELVERPNA